MADERSWRPDNDDAEEDEVDDTQYQSLKDAVIFAIEVSPSMLETPPEPPATSKRKKEHDSPTSAALKCAYELMQQRIISNPKDMIGVVLYGTDPSRYRDAPAPDAVDHPNCHVLVDLCVPSADEVRTLRDLVTKPDDFDHSVKPSQERVAMGNVLFCANQIFTTRAPNFVSRRLFIVTDQDNPHESDKALRSSAAVRARDLYDLGVTIELFPISRPGQSFDRSKFYNDILYSNTPSDPDASMPLEKDARPIALDEGFSLLQSLLSSVRSRSVPKRALFSNLPFEIGPGFKISVKGYIIFKRQEPARKSYIWLRGEKAEIVTNHSTKYADDTGRSIEKTTIKKAYKFGGAQIAFTPDDITELRNFGDPVIRIIGFKPLSALPLWANLRPSTFIYPSEEDYVGSTRVFSALQQKLLRDKKMGLAWFIARKNAAPVMAAVVPGEQQDNEDGEQTIPPGLWLVPVPYADDIRKNPEMMNIVSPDSVIDKMREVIQQLQLPKAVYGPERYPNPSLQWHYKMLQALALDEDVPTTPEDKTVPKYRQIAKRAGPYVQDWGEELENQHRRWQDENRDAMASLAVSGTKRPASKNVVASDERGKRVKSEAPEGPVSDKEMRAAFNSHRLEKFKVVELKDYLESKGLKGTGKKAELVTKVEQYLESDARK